MIKATKKDLSILIIAGPTASGKTSLSIELAKKFNSEVISADSRQVYKHLTIVTGKDLQLTDRVFHTKEKTNCFDIGYYKCTDENTLLWLYDIVEPWSEFSAYDYKICALEVIDDIVKRGKTPIIVGGSYLYIKNLLYDTVNTQIPPNKKLRDQLSKLSVEELQKKLYSYTSSTLQSLNESDQRNPHRLIRKIEIEEGRSEHKSRQYFESLSKLYHINLF